MRIVKSHDSQSNQKSEDELAELAQHGGQGATKQYQNSQQQPRQQQRHQRLPDSQGKAAVDKGDADPPVGQEPPKTYILPPAINTEIPPCDDDTGQPNNAAEPEPPPGKASPN